MSSPRTPGWPTGGSLLTSGEGLGSGSALQVYPPQVGADCPHPCFLQAPGTDCPLRADGQDEHRGAEEPWVQPPVGVMVLPCGPALWLALRTPSICLRDG